MKVVARLISEGEGGFSIVVPSMPGCVSQGESREEAIENICEAIHLYREVASKSDSDCESEPESFTVEIKTA